jgi:hypothetical protein
MRGFGQKTPLHHQLADFPLSVIACNHLPVDRMRLVDIRHAEMLRCSGLEPRRVNAVDLSSIAPRFQVPIWVG